MSTSERDRKLHVRPNRLRAVFIGPQVLSVHEQKKKQGGRAKEKSQEEAKKETKSMTPPPRFKRNRLTSRQKWDFLK